MTCVKITLERGQALVIDGAAWMGEATSPAACLHLHLAAPQLAKEAKKRTFLVTMMGDAPFESKFLRMHAQHVPALPCPCSMLIRRLPCPAAAMDFCTQPPLLPQPNPNPARATTPWGGPPSATHATAATSKHHVLKEGRPGGDGELERGRMREFGARGETRNIQ